MSEITVKYFVEFIVDERQEDVTPIGGKMFGGIVVAAEKVEPSHEQD